MVHHNILAWATTNNSNHLIVLRRWGDTFVVHLYLVDSDCFEYGNYADDIKGAAKKFTEKIQAYRRILDTCPF
jgi:nicotinic acid phosphoribosyltransferase